jgi:hypothetical protein
MSFLEPEHWPLWVGVGILIFANVWNQLTGKVPNGWTLPTLLVGLALAVVISLFPKLLPAAAGGIGSALLAVLLGGGAAIALWAAARWPGGCTKMQIAFCAWIGCGVESGGIAALLSTAGALLFSEALLLGFYLYYRNEPPPEENNQESPRYRTTPLQPLASLGAVAGLLVGRYVGWI